MDITLQPVGRTQQIAYDGRLSQTCPVQFGVPQGSILGPLLFVLYTAELSQVVTNHDLVLHQYADDCQVYVTTSLNDASSAVDQFSCCLNDVQRWMSQSRLLLNSTKTQVLWLGSKYQVERVSIRELPVLDTVVKVVDTARSLGVIVDSHLTMSAHVAAVCRAAYFQLRQIRLITRALSVDAARTLVQAFISCRLDYCNSLLCGITDNLLQRLQSVQNAAARLVTGVRRRDHITPVLRRLHWLPVRQRVNFKLAVFVYQALHNTTARYLVEDCQLVSNAGRRRLRSADIDTCIVLYTRTRLGDRSFSVAGPRLWNSLPAELRQPDVEIGQFRRLLKTFLFE